MPSKQNHHFFVATAFGWETHEDEQKAIENAARIAGVDAVRRNTKAQGGLLANLVRVELPQDAEYWIEDYMPRLVMKDGKRTDVQVPIGDYKQIRITSLKGAHTVLPPVEDQP